MKITDFLRQENIDAALAEAKDDNSFNYKSFFKKIDLTGKSDDQLKIIFKILDRNRNGFIEEDEFSFFLKNFDPKARPLTKNEVKDMMKDVHPKNKKKIGVDDFQALVKIAAHGNNV